MVQVVWTRSSGGIPDQSDAETHANFAGRSRTGRIRLWLWAICVVALAACSRQSAAPGVAETAGTGSGGIAPHLETETDGIGAPEAVLDPDWFKLPEAATGPGDGLESPGPGAAGVGGLELPDAVADPGPGLDLGAAAGPAGGDGDADPGDGSDSAGYGEDASQSTDTDTETVGGPVEGEQADLPGPLRVEPEEYGAGSFDLGFRYWPDRYALEQYSEEVVVRLDSVLVRDGVVRGLVQNMSERLFARDVVVSVGGRQWVFPLTVQPTEVVPFVIEGYAGSSDPGLIGFEVAAQLVTDPDPRRSFHISGLPGHWAESWAHLQVVFPNYEDDRPPEGTSGDDLIRYYETSVDLHTPTSHPSIADHATSQVIGDLRIYLTKLDADGRVLDVREMIPYTQIQIGTNQDGYPRWGHAPVDRLPFDGFTSFRVGFMTDVGFVTDIPVFGLTVGGAYNGSTG